MADDAHGYCRLVERLSGGRIRFEITATAADPIASLMAGAVEAVFGYEHDKVALHPGFAYFAGLPAGLGLPAEQHLAWLNSSATQRLWQRLSAEFGFTSLLAGHTAAPALLVSKEPLTGYPAFSGVQVDALGLGRDVVRGLSGKILAADASVVAQEVLRLEDLAAASMHAGLAAAPSPFATEGATTVLTVADAAVSTAERQVLESAARSIALSAAAEAEKRRSNELLLRAVARRVWQLNEYQLPMSIITDALHVCGAVVAEICGSSALTKIIDCSYTEARAAMGAPRALS